jgi:sugar phosphate isomerase/epimerase
LFPASSAEGRRAALDDNRRAVDEAKALGAACVVLVVGGLPGALQGKPEHKDLAAARRDVQDGIAATLEYARTVGMPLAIEPLHPMYAADRACVNTLEQALDLCDAIDPERSGALGVAVDAYHVWWIRSSRRRSDVPAANACWPSTCATGWCRRVTSSTTAG